MKLQAKHALINTLRKGERMALVKTEKELKERLQRKTEMRVELRTVANRKVLI